MTDELPPPPRRWPRLVALAALLLATWAVAHATGLTEQLGTKEAVRDLVRRLGPAGVVGFVGLFAVGELLHVPGLVFVGAAVLVWGPVVGGAIAGVGALVSLVTSFVVVRAVGGKPLGDVKGGLAGRLLANLERHPVRTIALARAVLILSPPVTYALALSGVRFRDYLLGSAVGLVPPMIVAAVIFDRMLNRP
jgi:uncharacterized membrane protein YdjX (TVP38/TMEM64 family)